jgi:hypothetical protein
MLELFWTVVGILGVAVLIQGKSISSGGVMACGLALALVGVLAPGVM